MKAKSIIIILVSILFSSNVFAQIITVKEQNGKYGFFNNNKQIISFKYDEVRQEKHVLGFFVRMKSKWGYVNPYGKETIACKYDSIQPAQTGFIVSLENLYGVVNRNDSILQELKNEQISFFDTDREGKNENVLTLAQIMPRFPGCEDQNISDLEKKNCSEIKMLEFIYSKIKYPLKANYKGIQGTVVIRFVIDKDGSIINPEIMRTIGGGCAEEALRVVKLMPPFIPGMQDGEPVKVQYNLPVRFKLEDPEPSELKKLKRNQQKIKNYDYRGG